MRKALFISISVLLVFSIGYTKNIVLFVGDGMGPTYVTATRLYLREKKQKLHLDTFKKIAIVQTFAADSVVTDSAASATAFACGVKTNNGVLGEDDTAVFMQKDGKKVNSIVHFAKQKGMSVGLVTTTRITHATPAAFYAHTNSRDDEQEIAHQLIKSGVDVLLGGGLKYFTPEMQEELKKQNYTVVKTLEEFNKIDSKKTQKLFGLLSDSHLAYELDRTSANIKEPSLTELVLKAHEVLKKNPKGYFLMVEGGRIDHAGHENDALRAIHDTIAFDKAIAAYQLVVTSKDTLVLVTADHETGGLSINGYPNLGIGLFEHVKEGDKKLDYPVLTWATGPGFGVKETAQGLFTEKQPAAFLRDYSAHSGVDVYLYGWGVGSEVVQGTLDNTDIFKIMKKAL
ncbi:MAG: alkaline phosphatase [Deltaproteobacteria bacterium]|nr:alkaline phosphatase [Deltaproteobacteria bacterium]